MNASSSDLRPVERDDSGSRGDLVLEIVLALEPLDEAVDVAFLAVKSAQHTARSMPDDATPARFRSEWRTSNTLLRQALRLIDERVQHLAKAIERLPRSD